MTDFPVEKIIVDVTRQELAATDSEGNTTTYTVSTASNGTGQENGSECTPLGHHVVRARIGDGQPVNTVFVGRRPTGEVYSPELRADNPARDWILTRILWLSGLEKGFNRSGNVDTMRRFIYIHGAPDEDEMGIPGSHGCIKMANSDVLELFERVSAGTPVEIVEGKRDAGVELV